MVCDWGYGVFCLLLQDLLLFLGCHFGVFFVRCLFCRSRLMPTLVRTAKYVNWPGTAMVSGCPSDWTPLCACSTLTPFSTFRMSTLNLTSARCWVRRSAAFPQIFTKPSFRPSFGCPRVAFDLSLFAFRQVRASWGSRLWGSQLLWYHVNVCGLAPEMVSSSPSPWQKVGFSRWTWIDMHRCILYKGFK